MEQHLYTFLNQKFGVKNIIVETTSSIINSTKKYLSEDNDVLIFSKILKNEIDEEFRFVQKQLKDTVGELLKINLKTKFSNKNDPEIIQMFKQKLTSFLLVIYLFFFFIF
jgi:hypothetical protein